MDSNLEAMLENEKDNLNDRIANLEKRVQQQDDEIICMKSTISEVLKRLQIIETQKSISSATAATPKPTVSNTRPASAAVATSKRPEKPVTTARSIKVDSSPAPATPTTANNKMTTATAVSTVVKKNIPSAKDKNTSFNYNDENKSVKMFLRGRPINFHLPSNNENYNIDSMSKAPKEHLKLEWVYGYRGKDCRSNLYQLGTGEIVYFIASTVVLFNIEENSQRHYLSHTDDIKCLAVHPDSVTIATGQVAGHDAAEGKPHIRIWNSVNLNTLQIIGFNSLDYFQNAICCLSFSKADGGENLCVVDDGVEKNLSVWNWQNNTKLASAKCYGDLIFASEFHPTEKNVIVSCGKQAIFFWNFDGTHLIKKSGTFDKIEKPKYILCVGFLPTGECVSGDSEGNILIWNHKEGKVNKQIKEAHEGGVFSIFVLPSSNSSPSVLMITGGGKDGKLVEWNNDYKKSGRFIQIPEANGSCRFVSQANGNMFLVGTTKNCIMRGNFDLNLTCVMNGHVDELWGLACNPREASFVTCGNDRLLLFWDILTHSLLWSLTIDENCGGAHCAHFHPTFNVLAVGHVKNKWSIFDLNERKSIFLQIEGTEQIECILYSPNGEYLAVGSRDNSIYVYTINEDGTKYSRIGRCTGHSSFITHIDWSTDSQNLMSNSGDYEILFWDVSTCKQLTHANQIRNLEWSSNNCTLSPTSFGIWSAIDVEIDTRKPGLKLSTLDGTDINSTCVSSSKRFLVSGDDFGCLNFHVFPCNTSKCEKRVLHGHSSHVTNVSFTNNDSRVISIGGNDMSIFEWSITNE